MMFQTSVKEAMKVPGLNYLHIVGTDSKGAVRIGERVTDGTESFEIVSIPFIRRADVRPSGEVDICIRADSNNPEDFIGKTLSTVQ